MKRAIITGATGAVGSALIRELIDHGVEVLVLCREGSRRNAQIPESRLVTRKFFTLDTLGALENDTGWDYDVFYHLAWNGTVGADRNDMYLQNRNVTYALDAVRTAQRFGCRRFIGAGSQAECGRVEGLLRPDTPAFPENGYGIAKLCAGQMTRELAHQLGLEHIWTRILSVYGPNDGAQSMVMSTIRKLLSGETPQFTKGEQMWDYLYSGDVASAFRLLGERGRDGKLYVLGSGQARPLADYIRAICDAAAPGAEIALGAIPYAPKQVMFLQADITEIRQDTGWEPTVPFEQGIRETIRSLR